jgi:hypothetical protein
MGFRILPFLILFSLATYGQCKTFKLGRFGDTLNCTDIHDLKQGKWVVHVDPLRGNPGYEEEGVFRNDKKEGMWRRFNLMGDKLAEENYYLGNKNGRCLYFDLAGLEHEESWRPPGNPDKNYDTLIVQDPVNQNLYEKVVVKTEGHSLRHGTWIYYDSNYGTIKKTEVYVLDVLKEPGDNNPLKSLKKLSDTATVNPNAGPVLPKIAPTPKFGKTPKKKSSVIQ